MTATNGANTATVETLVAEVRVLMVGSRQITLSVAKQLDRVHPDELEAFGRINTGDQEGIEVIGRSVKTGALVTSWALHPNSFGAMSPWSGTSNFTSCR